MYQPNAIPDNTPAALKSWLADQLRRIAAELNAPLVAPSFGAAPARPRNGVIVYAVDPWATDDLIGEGFYGFEDGNWVKL